MGIPSELKEMLVLTAKTDRSVEENEKILRTAQCAQEGHHAGGKAAAVAFVASIVPTFVAVQTIPWAKANLKHDAPARIVFAASIAAYFITARKTYLECARRNTDCKSP